MLGALPLVACATAPAQPPAPRLGPPQVVVAWSICAVDTTPDGRDLDDGGVSVTLFARGATPERAVIGHVTGSCWPSGPGTPPPLDCRDPHVDRRTAITARRAERTLIVERRDQPTDADGWSTAPEAPAVEVAALVLPVGAELAAGRAPSCP